MIRRHPDSLAGEDARAFARELEGRYAYPEWAVTYDVDEIEGDGEDESGIRELLLVAKRTNGVLEQVFWIDVDEILDMREAGADWLEEVDAVITSAEDELEGGGPVEGDM